MINAILGIIPGLFTLGGKMIEDKDKKNEYAFKVLEMTHQLMLKLLETKTYPWIDGLVKLAYASESIIKGLFRPLASTAAAIFVAYCELNEIALSPMIETVFVGLLPAWGVSRWNEKKKGRSEPEAGELGW